VAEIIRAGLPDSLGHIDTTQGDFRTQIDAITDTVRQLGGNPNVSATTSDPLNAPFVLYVDPNIGSDVFVSGDYTTTPNTTYEDKMRRISLQRLQCGYTQSRPFRTINRAIIEAGIITSRDYLDLNPAPCGDLVSIVLSPAVHTILNDVGSGTTTPWVDGQDPTDAQLIEFNNNNTGGVLLPRGVSLISLDLRKTILRPNAVPAPANEAPDLSNRRACFKLTGGCYCYGFTVMDKQGSSASHHLLDVFQFTTQAELDQFYAKIVSSFGEAVFTDFVNDDYAEARTSEYQIVGPQPVNPTPAVDTISSSSPYIYNISIRSVLGMCGLLADGARVPDSFRSCVIAQYTGVSLQKDFTSWQIYAGGTWSTAASAGDIIGADPNDVRVDPQRRSVHIRAVNNAVIQEVSVFAIGQAIHHLSESGSNVTITNSNSNFGGCASLAIGFTDKAAPSDGDWSTVSVSRALDPFVKSNSVQKIFLGRLSDTGGDNPNNTTTLILDQPLSESTAAPGQPDVLARDNYSLKEDDLVWVLNPSGDDYQAELAATAWQASDPAQVNIKASLQTGVPAGDRENPDGSFDLPDIAGLRVYVRRLKDTRTTAERTYTVKLQGASNLRIPNTDYILRDVAGNWNEARLSAVAQANLDLAGSNRTVDVQLRNANTQGDMAWEASTYYRVGDVIRRNNKHFTAIRDNYGTVFEPYNWDESFVHMASDYDPESPLTNSAPKIIFDGDTDADNENTVSCGFTLANAEVIAQYQSATDYKGMQYYLTTTGSAISLVPQGVGSRDIALNSDEVEFRRPSNVRLYSHAFEWSGYGNYSTGLPQYQGTLSENNKFTYYFTNENGGKCYVSGFNEEGLQVTSAGLVNLETGQSVSIVDIGQDDVAVEPPPLASLNEPGLIQLQDAATITGLTAAEIATLNTAISGNTPAVTEPYLDAYLDAENYVVSPGRSAIKVIHVVPANMVPLTGAASVPYGLPSTAPGVPYTDQSDRAATVTDAIRLAERVFVPTGASVVISVHGNIEDAANNPITEVGPLQLLNGYAEIIVAGARGSSGAAGPVINISKAITATSTERIPQYRTIKAYSAGVIWADCDLRLDMNNESSPCYATFNGGFGVGGKNTTLRWYNTASGTASTSSYGGPCIFQYYDNDDQSKEFIQILESSSASIPVLEFMGAGGASGDDENGSGLVGQGTTVLIDFLKATVGEVGKSQLTFTFVNNTSVRAQCTFISLGGRGGVRAGGRVAPEVNLNFSNDDWDLSYWVSNRFYKLKNYYGPSFGIKSIPNGSTPQAFYALSSNSLATINTADICVLTNGCCIDVPDVNAPNAKCGPFALYFALMKYNNDGTLLLRAKNGNGSFVYGGNTVPYNSLEPYSADDL